MFKKERQKNITELLFFFFFLPSLFLLFFLSFVCLHYLCWDFYSASPRPSSGFCFLAQLQGANESISGKHVDFCFHGDPEGLTMSRRLRPTGCLKRCCLFPSFIHTLSLDLSSTLHHSLSLLITFYISLKSL